MTTLLPGI